MRDVVPGIEDAMRFQWTTWHDPGRLAAWWLVSIKSCQGVFGGPDRVPWCDGGCADAPTTGLSSRWSEWRCRAGDTHRETNILR